MRKEDRIRLEWRRWHRHKHRRQRRAIDVRTIDKARKVKLLRAPACHAYAYLKAWVVRPVASRVLGSPFRYMDLSIRQWRAEWLKQCLLHGPKWRTSTVITAVRKEIADVEAQLSVF